MSDEHITYEQAKQMARHEDVSVRQKLAARGDLRPEILYFLVDDPSHEVRQVLAENLTTPAQADVLLARDAHESVRATLAQKIGRLAPGLTDREQDKVRKATYEALEVLTRDQMTLVRGILSETLKDLTDAPPDVIRKLARDAELSVSAPILEFSPVLTDDDLLDIIRSTLPAGALSSIARRAGVSGDVSHSIAETGDLDAVAALLGNHSAQIREETLDVIIESAPETELWHEPLVRRPDLPPTAVRKVAQFVARSMLEILSGRDDLDADTVGAVRQEVERRLEEETGIAGLPGSLGGDDSLSPSAQRAHDLFEKDELDADAVDDALMDSDRLFVKEALVLLSEVPRAAVEDIVAQRSAKGMVALAWKSGLTMRMASKLQQRLSNIPPHDILYAKEGEGYPLDEHDMEWQIDFFLSAHE